MQHWMLRMMIQVMGILMGLIIAIVLVLVWKMIALALLMILISQKFLRLVTILPYPYQDQQMISTSSTYLVPDLWLLMSSHLMLLRNSLVTPVA